MIEKLYHTESYAEPINSIIKKVNELVCAQNAVVEQRADNKQSDAITLWKEALIYAETGDMNKWFLLNHERINTVLA